MKREPTYGIDIVFPEKVLENRRRCLKPFRMGFRGRKDFRKVLTLPLLGLCEDLTMPFVPELKR